MVGSSGEKRVREICAGSMTWWLCVVTIFFFHWSYERKEVSTWKWISPQVNLLLGYIMHTLHRVWLRLLNERTLFPCWTISFIWKTFLSWVSIYTKSGSYTNHLAIYSGHSSIYLYIYLYIYIYIYIYISEVVDCCRGWPKGSLFNSYYTEV